MILLFTDFGYEGPYVGQMKAVLARMALDAPVIDLMHDAPSHDPSAAAHLLAALVSEMPSNAVCLAVVDPGVGSDRLPVTLRADGRWFVGPDNGLLELVQRRAHLADQWAITWRPKHLSRSFHGRDLFAPVTARLARGEIPPGRPYPAGWRILPERPGADWPDDRAAVVYIDRFGNAMTGLRASLLEETQALIVGEVRIKHAAIFSEVPLGQVFWYVNSCGLVEIAANRANAATICQLNIGDEFNIADR
ncbi:MAG: hypothetical protein CMM55_11050 [Rhodospirillaceae bacterium]|nr:hypothetical protein [Rhodospirillaceae bacterium]